MQTQTQVANRIVLRGLIACFVCAVSWVAQSCASGCPEGYILQGDVCKPGTVKGAATGEAGAVAGGNAPNIGPKSSDTTAGASGELNVGRSAPGGGSSGSALGMAGVTAGRTSAPATAGGGGDSGPQRSEEVAGASGETSAGRSTPIGGTSGSAMGMASTIAGQMSTPAQAGRMSADAPAGAAAGNGEGGGMSPATCVPASADNACPRGAHCVNGNCVQCSVDSDCAAMSESCREAYCSSGMCQKRNRLDGDPCSGLGFNGLCKDGTCNNLECITSLDCTGQRESCYEGKCVSCGNDKIDANEQCDIGTASSGSDGLAAGTLYNDWNCNPGLCTRRYIFTPCKTATECGGTSTLCLSTIGACMKPCPSVATTGTGCTLDNGRDGVCNGGLCLAKCDAGASNCPLPLVCQHLQLDVNSSTFYDLCTWN